MANNEEISQDVKVEETSPATETEVVETVDTDNVEAKSAKVETSEVKEVKATKVEKAKKQKKSKDKKPNKVAKSLKETSSELKKVTWPKFGEVVKKTGIVLAVTTAFLLVVFGIDRLCSWLVGFIV